MKLYFRQTELGEIGIAEIGGSVTNVYLDRGDVPQDAEICETDLIREAFRQLEAYLAGDLKRFSLPLAPAGTEFMRKVWTILVRVPYGKTASYKDIAEAAGNPGAARAVGQANNRNPIPVFIPCHRIIGANGKLVGYRGGLDMKQKLLDLERREKTA
ncbi:MAG TPA: methylated-DNA--[protein]-cysteine S-methyltransferase [Syntrophales bacterium]|jgi:methylated-DNA-[protein]-cysteine S-methyltransferase|nr:methylated-DNA--[protein]-cysteine S-methyltransferase [Syntrophales bacterium]HPX55660.1 methylated-DNA--[protein]-cysteine S-methyltransferase [Syntrophales bacterium]HQA83015.1 methylated-DNA--[protein]-cysteine S-methyltransferase [Syntrophales bacterium]